MTRAPIAHPTAGKRLRRARGWLGMAFLVHGTTFVFVLFAAAAGGSIRPTAAALAAGALAVLSLVLLLWWERRLPTARRPALWVRRGTMVVLLNAVAFGIAAGAVLDRTSPPSWEKVVLFACAPLVIEYLAIRLASGALRRPLSSDLGEMNIEVLAKIRSSAEWRPSWLANDDVRLADDSIVITVRPDSKWAFVARIEFADVVDVDIRRTTAQDGPWFVADGGRMFWPPSGDVVAIKHRQGSQLLPVYEPAGFAEVLRARIRKATSAGGSGLSGGTTSDRGSG
jgi:hypothetical protein